MYYIYSEIALLQQRRFLSITVARVASLLLVYIYISESIGALHRAHTHVYLYYYTHIYSALNYTALTSTLLLLLRRGAAAASLLLSGSAAAAPAVGYYFAMADVSVNMSTSRKMSFGFNGKMNGVEGKTPFLIGVSGGTASGKVTRAFFLCNI